MTLTEIQNILAQSSATDWNRNEVKGEFIYINDISLRIEREPISSWQDFDEAWIPSFFSPNTQSVCFTVKYNGQRLEDKRLILMNGQAYIPLPDLTDLSVKASDVNFAKIVTIDNTRPESTVNNWLEKCRFTVI